MAHLDLETGRWFAADAKLGKRDTRRIGNNTTLERRRENDIAVRLHHTDVYTMTPEGWAIVDTGDWYTVTTWQRINAVLPGPWAVWSNGKAGRYLFRDGYPVTPYADGLAVHVGTTATDATGAVGFRTASGVTVLLTPAEVDGIVAVAVTAAQHRADLRATRLLREHPEPRLFQRVLDKAKDPG